jgi:hypothetical protein
MSSRSRKRFDVSFTVAALRFLDITNAPCAFVEMRGAIVKRASGTPTFRGDAVRGRSLEAPFGARVWSLPVEGADVSLAWVSHA